MRNVRAGFMALALIGAAVVPMSSCTLGRTTPEPAVSSLVVRNRSYFDVNVYTVPSALARPVRIGTVIGSSTATFPLWSRNLQPGGELVVIVHAIGAPGSWTSDAVSITSGVLAVLDVNSDMFGDCSTSSLHTIVVGDSLPHGGR